MMTRLQKSFQDLIKFFSRTPQNIWPVLLLLGLLIALAPQPFLASTALAQSPRDPTEAMLAANRSYEVGQFEEAAAGYEAILEAGLSNSDLYYNLGNAYFKQGDLGRAILNYRRAQRLDPRDGDITANLNVARTQTVDQLERGGPGMLANWVQVAEEWLTLSEAAILALFLWFILNFLAILTILLPRLRRLLGMAMAVVALFLMAGLISIANRFYVERQYPPAVIVARQVDVTSGPGSPAQYLTEFELHAGAEVHLLESRASWRRITLPGDLQGWVPAEAVEPVIEE